MSADADDVPLTADPRLAEEFFRNPLGRHSPGLQRLLREFRRQPLDGKHALLCTKPGREWTLAQLPAERGGRLTIHWSITFSSVEDAERHVLRLRWERHFGSPLAGSPMSPAESPAPGPDVRMKTITGYADRLSAMPGESLSFMVSCDGPASRYEASLVRLTCTDASPAGPGLLERKVASEADGSYPARRQTAHAGSCAVIPADPRFSSLRSFTLQALVWPTTPDKGLQTILSLRNPDSGGEVVLGIDASGCLSVRVSDGRGREAVLAATTPILARRWYLVAAAFDAGTRRLTLLQISLALLPPGLIAEERCQTAIDLAPDMTGAPLVIAASPAGPSFAEHFNGKIERPRLLASALPVDEMEAAMAWEVPERLGPALVGAWDFALATSSERIVDVSDNALHGRTVNMPARAAAGASWTGEIHDWKHAPEQYGAIHFHDDDMIDAGWAADFTLSLPEDLPSGVYAMKLGDGGYPEYVVFFVRPRPGTSANRIAYLASTATYLAYGNFRAMETGPVAEAFQGALPVLTWEDLALAAHPELGDSLYGSHSDGSGICYSSARRPLQNMRPNTSYWCFNGDQFVVAWLETLGRGFDVITDGDLEREGLDLLRPYAVVLTGGHPEYASARMLDALRTWRDAGGRLMYLGGNGFYWRIAWHPEMPDVIEVRRAEDGARAWAAEPGEYYMSFTGEYGGMWRRNGRPPNTLVGVGFVAQGFDSGGFYKRTAASLDPRVAFIFEGVGQERIGDFGIAGNGAAGQEIDRVNAALGTPETAIVVASSEGHSEYMLVTKEEFALQPLFVDATNNPAAHADMVLFAAANGGAVFSVGSISWPASLPINGFDNNVARITENVLRRFLDPTPLPIPEP